MKSSMLRLGLSLALLLIATAHPAPAQDPFGGQADDPFGSGQADDPFGGSDDPFGRAAEAIQPPATAPEPVAPTADQPAPPPAAAQPEVPNEVTEEPAEAQAPPEDAVTGTIRRVTLYRNQAMVTREIPIEPGETNGTITVVDLPEQLIAESVFAEGDENVQIRAVRVISNPTLSSDRQEVREIENAIAENQQTQARLEQELRVITENLNSIVQITSFTAAKANDDLNEGTLNAETVTQLGSYLMDQRRALMMEQLEKQQDKAELTKELGLLQFRLNDLVAGDRSKLYQAKIFIDAAPDAAGTVKLNYLVGGCGWSPQYTVRGWVDRDQFLIRYSAMVQQISGEPWNEVSLTLSTASPSVSATGPTLTPFRISTTAAPGQEQQAVAAPMDPSQLAERAKSIRQQQRNIETNALGGMQSASPVQRDVQLNTLAAQLQQLELQAEAKTAARIAGDADDEVATQVYQIDQPVSLESRRQQQLVRIDELELEGQMYHVAIPLLASYAYREAEVTNTSDIGLLGGPAAVYLDDRFVGQTPVLTTAAGQKLVLGFGADQQVRTRRELRSKEDSIRGGNRHLEFTYRLVISNFKDQSVDVRLYDRIPIASETREVAVDLTAPEIPLSTDPLYERMAKQRGILRWDLEVPAETNGSEAFDVDYTYSLEFDRSQTLSSQELTEQIEADYFFQQRAGGMGGMGMGTLPGSATP